MAADAASVSDRTAQAIEAIIRGLKLTPTPTNIVRRKKLAVQDGDNSRSIFIEVADEESFEPVSNGTANGTLLWVVRRPCGVALGYSSGGKVSDNPDLRVHRGLIEHAITMGALQRAGLNTAIGSANDVLPSGRMVFDAVSTPGVDWSVMSFAVETLEERPYGI